MKRLIAVALLISSSALAEDFAKDTMPQYFPISTNRNPVNAVKPFCSEWFSLYLHMMQEPSLFEATNRTDLAIYRFTELPSWGRPLAVRAVVATNQVYVRTVILSGNGGYDPGIIGQIKETVSGNALPQAVSKLIDSTIWNNKFQPVSHYGCDGTEWIVEGVKNGRYRVIVMWTPDAYSEDPQVKLFIDLCKTLVRLSGETMEKVMQDCDTLNLNKDPLRKKPNR